jgi:hypothetical protein
MRIRFSRAMTRQRRAAMAQHRACPRRRRRCARKSRPAQRHRLHHIPVVRLASRRARLAAPARYVTRRASVEEALTARLGAAAAGASSGRSQSWASFPSVSRRASPPSLSRIGASGVPRSEGVRSRSSGATAARSRSSALSEMRAARAEGVRGRVGRTARSRGRPIARGRADSSGGVHVGAEDCCERRRERSHGNEPRLCVYQDGLDRDGAGAFTRPRPRAMQPAVSRTRPGQRRAREGPVPSAPVAAEPAAHEVTSTTQGRQHCVAESKRTSTIR